MTLEEKTMYLAHAGIEIFHLYDWMDHYNLNSLDETIEHYYDHHYPECKTKKEE